MTQHLVLFGLTLMVIIEVASTRDSYSAVVVEYSPLQDPTTHPATNILNNVMNFVQITKNASKTFQADIIVFPEIGLRGYGNQEQHMFVPDPQEKVRPCATNTTCEAPLVQLSCLARSTQTYIVVNLGEKFYNSSQQKMVYFNTDVVFDLNGTIIVRYRKIHLFAESGTSPSPNKELAYFDTEFGVRFGIFTCFDIIFEDPGVILANKFNITHFIYPTAWFSEMPFFTAIQEQYYWSYTQDVVLLASGYNDPSVGSSGTGIYLGRQGPVVYNMTDTKQTFMLQADIPKNVRLSGKGAANKSFESEVFTIAKKKEELKETASQDIKDKIKIRQEPFLKTYTTKVINPNKWPLYHYDTKSFQTYLIMRELVCHNSLCCQFSLNITANFNEKRKETTRGDDYSELFYRLAVFDGVRDYFKTAVGGVQTCAVIACVNSDVSSCGLRSDDSLAEPNMIYSFYQTDLIFNSITISGNFSNHRSSVGPKFLLTGEGDNFGSLLPAESFNFSEAPYSHNGTLVRIFQTLKPIPNLVTGSLYGRIFSRDAEINVPDSARHVSGSFYTLITLQFFYVLASLLTYT